MSETDWEVLPHWADSGEVVRLIPGHGEVVHEDATGVLGRLVASL